MRLVHGPMLRRAAVAGCENQRCLVVGCTTLDVDAHPTDARDGAIGFAPVLTRTTITGDVDDGRTQGRSAALHIETKSTHSDDVPIVEGPLLVLPRVTLLDVHGGARHRVPVVHDIHALVGVAAGDGSALRVSGR